MSKKPEQKGCETNIPAGMLLRLLSVVMFAAIVFGQAAPATGYPEQGETNMIDFAGLFSEPQLAFRAASTLDCSFGSNPMQEEPALKLHG